MIWESLLISLGINYALFIPGFLKKTDKLTDLSYSVSFIVIALVLFLFNPYSIEKLLLTTMIVIWGVRLGSFLFKRIRKMKKDKRFDGMRDNFWRFGLFWTIQAFTVWLIMMAPIQFYNNNTSFNVLSIIGLIIWAAGLLIEMIADNQKYDFKQDRRNRGDWIESGLWNYSRHPNYFGEITHWLGVYLFCLSSLQGLEAVIGLLTPFYITITLLFISGIPILEHRADQRWGKNKKYQAYKKRTSVLIPWFVKK